MSKKRRSGATGTPTATQMRSEMERMAAEARVRGDRAQLIAALKGLAELCDRLEEWTGARAAAEELVALGASDAAMWTILADARRNLVDLPGAAQAYGQAAALVPTRRCCGGITPKPSSSSAGWVRRRSSWTSPSGWSQTRPSRRCAGPSWQSPRRSGRSAALGRGDVATAARIHGGAGDAEGGRMSARDPRPEVAIRRGAERVPAPGRNPGGHRRARCGCWRWLIS